MRKVTAFAGLGLAAALVLTGCAAEAEAPADEPTMEQPAPEADAPMIDTVNSDGANLRAALTALLADHVYLAGAAINQALADGGDLETPAVQAAVTALDENSVEVAALVGSAYPDAEQPFLDSWRSHIPFFVNYTLGQATGDQELADQAVADLGAYAVSFGELINSVVPELPAEAVQAELEMHATTLLAAIDANIAGDPAYFDLLKEAASHMPMTANALAGGIAANLGLQ
ncbi:hypothetical protein [Microcella alkaliphila]|uniref:Lipoprotein n=1 Tax=Microcella alkaliphila TaxID=279828 RepID=A0A0U5BBZ4_9MICO|nr:hypothetical protein [Microcella alkaliphila]BAU33268.1 uncharacterized protein MalAC0309_2427 [Microcella alkaliphila]